MRYLVFVASLLAGGAMMCSCTSCSETTSATNLSYQPDTTDIIHYNIVIVPDLSNRLNGALYPKPISDYEITKAVIDNLYPKILTHRRSENQEDKVSVAFINKKVVTDYSIDAAALKIDFSPFTSQLNRIHYVKGRAERTFSEDTALFLQEFKRMTTLASRNPAGADIWSFLENGVDNMLVEKSERIALYNNRVYRNRFRNILVLTTDGYIEAGLYMSGGCSDQPNQCYYLSKRRVEDFRNAFKRSGGSDIREFFKKNNYGIVPVKNAALQDLEILALEFYDRSLTPQGTPSAYPSDWEILKLFWEDWLAKSGVKKYELRQIATSRKAVEESILRFLKVE